MNDLTKVCQKCGNPITEGKFCDADCRRLYFEEIRKNNIEAYESIIK